MLGAPVEEMARPGAGLERHRRGPGPEIGPQPPERGPALPLPGGRRRRPAPGGVRRPVHRGGRLYPFAPVGATLPGGMTIRKAKIRGEHSQGMLCSEQELGLGKDAGGDHAPRRRPSRSGRPVVGALGLDDTRLTLEVTPNRPDLLSHVGVAREVAPDGHARRRAAAVPGRGLRGAVRRDPAPVELRRADQEGLAAGRPHPHRGRGRLPRYMAAVIDGVRGRALARLARRPAPRHRPAAHQQRGGRHELRPPRAGPAAARLRPDRLKAPPSWCAPARPARPSRRWTTWSRKLAPDMLVIADAGSPVAVAGVMGGAESEVSGATTNASSWSAPTSTPLGPGPPGRWGSPPTPATASSGAPTWTAWSGRSTGRRS
jgi:phenylalanyl-tRNA synthetase beta chain